MTRSWPGWSRKSLKSLGRVSTRSKRKTNTQSKRKTYPTSNSSSILMSMMKSRVARTQTMSTAIRMVGQGTPILANSRLSTSTRRSTICSRTRGTSHETTSTSVLRLWAAGPNKKVIFQCNFLMVLFFGSWVTDARVGPESSGRCQWRGVFADIEIHTTACEVVDKPSITARLDRLRLNRLNLNLDYAAIKWREAKVWSYAAKIWGLLFTWWKSCWFLEVSILEV